MRMRLLAGAAIGGGALVLATITWAALSEPYARPHVDIFALVGVVAGAAVAYVTRDRSATSSVSVMRARPEWNGLWPALVALVGIPASLIITTGFAFQGHFDLAKYPAEVVGRVTGGKSTTTHRTVRDRERSEQWSEVTFEFTPAGGTGAPIRGDAVLDGLASADDPVRVPYDPKDRRAIGSRAQSAATSFSTQRSLRSSSSPGSASSSSGAEAGACRDRRSSGSCCRSRCRRWRSGRSCRVPSSRALDGSRLVLVGARP